MREFIYSPDLTDIRFRSGFEESIRDEATFVKLIVCCRLNVSSDALSGLSLSGSSLKGCSLVSSEKSINRTLAWDAHLLAGAV